MLLGEPGKRTGIPRSKGLGEDVTRGYLEKHRTAYETVMYTSEIEMEYPGKKEERGERKQHPGKTQT